MRFSLSFAANLALLAVANAQSAELLSTALEDYDDLSLFRNLLAASPQALQNAITGKSTNITVLIPTNDAISAYLKSSGIQDVSSLGSSQIEIFFAYHIMSASLKSTDFDDDRGAVVPTLLKKSEFNNRTAGAQLTKEYGAGATGQVLVAGSAKSSSRRIKRQDFKGPSVTLRAGLAQDAQMTAIDGSWGPKKVNTFQVVDSVLLPPLACSTTIRSITKGQLSALDAALNKTELYPTLDTTKNVTCLAPSTSAFKAAGDPQTSLPKSNLTHALLAHTLKEVTYTTFLEDGMILETYDNSTVTVHIKGDDIYFNNAKIIEPNVLTNNGLLHILDAVIEAETDEPTGTSTASSDSPSSTSSSSASASESNAASASSVGFHGLVALVAGLMMM
ncbi:FAS1 domain-containing protein [Thelonectria olida]|uniref:FAS1 domain-containing protein n=1 Tax=Thelonectria olida TaxID=1576542 RepID=A0A9P8VYH3_9HYPO|nr:FAS1 domain-containing protein [Thelonectria olida]